MKHLAIIAESADDLGQSHVRMPARDKRLILYAVAGLLDVLSLVAGYFLALEIRDVRYLEAGGKPIILLALPIFIMIALAREVHALETLDSRLLAVQRALGSLGATALVVLGLGFMVDADEISRVGFSLAFGGAAIFMIIGKFIVDALFKAMLDGTALKTVILCDGLPCKEEKGVDRFDVGKFEVWPDPERPDKIDMLSRIVSPYDRVVVACEYSRRGAWATFLKGLDIGGEILLDRDVLLGAVAIGNHQGSDTLVMSLGPLNVVNRIQKRCFDVFAAGLLLLILAPLLIFTALAIKLDSPGPVLFRQRRVGLGNRHFDILKFRSMRSDSCDADGDRSTGREDDRITRVGRFIRRTSIDELPQLLNVLRGEMSMVGPRPHALGSRAGESLFWEASEYYWMRHALKPGLTGLAQIRGYRGATETEEDLEMRVRCDLEYLSNWSLWYDVIIILKTARVVVHQNAF